MLGQHPRLLIYMHHSRFASRIETCLGFRGPSSRVLCAALRPRSLQNNKRLIIEKERDDLAKDQEHVLVGRDDSEAVQPWKRNIFHSLELPPHVHSRKHWFAFVGFLSILFLLQNLLRQCTHSIPMLGEVCSQHHNIPQYATAQDCVWKP